jgi:hypothetical protein
MSDGKTTFAQAVAVVDRLYCALASKDMEAARACCSPTARFWHSFDGLAQDLDRAAQGWQGLFAMFLEHRIIDVRRAALPDGLVQRHLLLLRGEDGVLKGKPCCIFVNVQSGVINRLDEYIDLSADLQVDDEQITAGLPAKGII